MSNDEQKKVTVLLKEIRDDVESDKGISTTVLLRKLNKAIDIVDTESDKAQMKGAIEAINNLAKALAEKKP